KGLVREAIREGRGIVEHRRILTRRFTSVQKYVGIAAVPESYRINDEPDQVRREQDRLRMLSRVADGRTRRALIDVGIATGWHCCDVGSGAGVIAAWMAEQV